MKQIIILVLISLLVHSIYTKHGLRKHKQQPIAVPQELDAYPQAILTEMNYYLAQYSFPELVWNEQLKETSESAAQEILASNNFGQHSSIEQWQAKVPNDIFTEIQFVVNVTNSNYYSKSLSSKTSKIMYDTKMSVGTIMKTVTAPSAEMFAKNIIDALSTEHLLLTLNQYSNCGISLVPLDQAKYPNEYLTVIHLIKSAGELPAEQPQEEVYTSCKDAQTKGNTAEEITILVDGQKTQVKCNLNEDNGGWTLLATITKDATKDSTVIIDDMKLDYTELLFIANQDHWAKWNPSGWTSKGFNFAMNTLKFGDKWWASTETPYTRKTFDAWALNAHYTLFKDVDRIDESDQCDFNNINKQGYCCWKFIFKKLPEGRFGGISDVESLTGYGNYDNSFHYSFQVFVR